MKDTLSSCPAQSAPRRHSSVRLMPLALLSLVLSFVLTGCGDRVAVGDTLELGAIDRLEPSEPIHVSDEEAIRAAIKHVADLNKAQTGPILDAWHQKTTAWVQDAWIASGALQSDVEHDSQLSGVVCPADDGVFHVVYVTMSVEEEGIEDTAIAASQTSIAVTFRGVLGEDATPQTLSIDYQAVTMVRLDGVVVGIETTGTLPTWLDAADVQALDKAKIVGIHGTPTLDAAKKLASAASSRAKLIVKRIEKALTNMWTNGYCVGLSAPLNALVSPNEQKRVEVNLFLKSPEAWEIAQGAEGDEVEGNVTVKLDGGAKVDPEKFRTGGTFTYTANTHPGDRAWLTITATSRRGGDVKTIFVEVGKGAWVVIGGTDGYLLSEADNMIVCDLDKDWGVIVPGSTEADIAGWAFAGAQHSFFVRKGDFYRTRVGTWKVVYDDERTPKAVELSYSEGYEFVQNEYVRDLGGGSGHFDLKPVPRPPECDAAG